MKKIVTIIILGFIICTAFKTDISLQRKNHTKPIWTDYRDEYIGSYFCKSICNNYNKQTKSRDFETDTLSFIISKDAVDSVLQIKINQYVLKVKLKNKFMHAYYRAGHYGGNFFAADSLDFSFALGRSSSCRYMGKKK